MSADTPSTDVATQDDDRTPAEKLLDTVRTPRFRENVAMALPEGVPPERFVRVAITALMENADLAAADAFSVRNSLMKAAADGLMPDSREAALVLFKGKDGVTRAQYLPMILGLRKLAAQAGWSIRTAVVYKEDGFDYELGVDPTVRHKRAPVGKRTDEIVAAYAVARRHSDGAVELLVMERDELDKVRKTAKAQTIWNEWPERMYEKTVARRLWKELPLGESDAVRRIRRALDVEELEPGDAEALVYGPPGGGGESSAGEVSGGPDPSAAHEEEPVVTSPGSPAPPPYSGEEPGDELEAARDVVLPEWSKHAGLTLGQLADGNQRGYLQWLSSEAVDDEALRANAARVLASLR